MTQNGLITPYLREELFKDFIEQTPQEIESFQKMQEEEKIALLEEKFEDILRILGLDLSAPSMKETPKRMARMFIHELFSGLQPENFPNFTFADFTPNKDSSHSVFIKNIRLNTICEHHFLPMIGIANIAYIPNGKTIGVSNVNCIAEYFAKRPQIQEKLMAQIAESLSLLLSIKDIAVHIEMKHLCLAFLKTSDPMTSTETTFLKGKFKDELKSEFLQKVDKEKLRNFF